MSNSQIITPHGHTLSDMSSLIQKAIRRNHVDEAIYAASEMEACNPDYMWLRIFTTAAEDCFDLNSQYVWQLYQAYSHGNEFGNVEKAIGILCEARKNRDADYFACNIMNSRDVRDICKAERIPEELQPYVTKNGHNILDCTLSLMSGLQDGDYALSGYPAKELHNRYPDVFWAIAKTFADRCCDQKIVREIEALHDEDVWQRGDSHATPILVAKAIIILVKTVKYGAEVFETSSVPVGYRKRTDLCLATPFVIPEYVYDIHTLKGKEKGMTIHDFLRDEQQALSPYVQGDFHEQPWTNFLRLLTVGFYNKDNIAPCPCGEQMEVLNQYIPLILEYSRLQ